MPKLTFSRSCLLVAMSLSAPLAAAQASETFIQQAGLSFSTEAAPELAGAGLASREALDAAVLGISAQTNVIAVSQRGIMNKADIVQSGQGNLVGLDIVGNENLFSLSQIGNGNTFVGDVIGSSNEILDGSVQAGANNSYTLLLAGTATQPFSISQVGNENNAVQFVETGVAPASISQRGNGLQLTVERR